MSFIHLESLGDTREKYTRKRYTRNIAFAVLVTGTAILSILFISGLSHYTALSIDPAGALSARETSLTLRPDGQVSTYLYDRRSFRWFIGLTANTALTGLAIFGTYAACVSVTGGLGGAACAAAAVGIVGAAIGLIPSGSGQVVTNDLELGETPDVDYVQNGSKRDESREEQFKELLRQVLGPDYQFEGHVDATDEYHADLVTRNGGQPVPVHSFTAKGIRFHHSFVFHKEGAGVFHRFGFATPSNDTTVSRRQEAESSNEYFKSGGLDLFDCAVTGSSSDHLNSGDASDMTSLIQCNDSNFGNAQELDIQVYDADTMETIGAGKIAPYDGGKSIISGETGSGNCPTSEPSVNSCSMDTSLG